MIFVVCERNERLKKVDHLSVKNKRVTDRGSHSLQVKFELSPLPSYQIMFCKGTIKIEISKNILYYFLFNCLIYSCFTFSKTDFDRLDFICPGFLHAALCALVEMTDKTFGRNDKDEYVETADILLCLIF